MKKPVFEIRYNKKDITMDITPFVESVSYTDNEHGQSDELEIVVDNSDGRWTKSWYPTKGDVLSAKIGHEGGKLLDCGSFEIEEPQDSGPPDVLTIKAVSTNITKALRTLNTIAYENTTLEKIARDIAKRNGLELVGKVKDIPIKRKTQKNTTDIRFLKNLAEEYGQVFKIVDNKLVFYDLADLKKAESALSISKNMMQTRSFRDKADEVYSGAEVIYHDPKTKKQVKYSYKTEGADTADVLKINRRYENKQQAEETAKAALERTNGRKIEGSFTIEGETRLVSGINADLTDLGVFSGKYSVVRSSHRIDKSSGYTTDAEVAKGA